MKQLRRPVKPHHHGTTTGYSNGCRCAACTKANTEQSRRWRARLLPADKEKQYKIRNARRRKKKAENKGKESPHDTAGG